VNDNLKQRLDHDSSARPDGFGLSLGDNDGVRGRDPDPGPYSGLGARVLSKIISILIKHGIRDQKHFEIRR
jgi:hypothetical protein